MRTLFYTKPGTARRLRVTENPYPHLPAAGEPSIQAATSPEGRQTATKASAAQQPIRAAAIHVNASSITSRTRGASTVPTFSSSGRRLRNYSLVSVERMLAATPPICSVKRNRKTGKICSVQLFPLPQNSLAVEGKEPLRKTAHMGQTYSFAQAVDDYSGRRVWRFAEFLNPRDRMNRDIESYIMSIFRAVPLSCISEGRGFQPLSAEEILNPSCASEERPEPPTPANIIEMRPRRKAPPVDTSELLAA